MLAYVFVVLAVLTRLVPHTFSFTPVGAALLFFGAQGSRKRGWVPVALLAASDVYLTIFHYGYPFVWDHLLTWAWYAAIVFLGTRLRGAVRPLPVLGASLATAISFFLISNFGVWAAYEMYPHTWSGLATAYVAAIPFFRSELVSNLLFAAIFFSIPVLTEAMNAARARREVA